MHFAVALGWLGSGIVLGLLSVPHCVAMCGPVAAYACSGTSKRGVGVGLYQGARMLGYAVSGGLAGLAGSALTSRLSVPWARAVASLGLALVLLWTAVRLGRAWWHGRGGRESAAAGLVYLRTKAPGARLRPLWVGLVTALFPCGALWAALVAAAGSGAVVSGVMVLLGFAAASGLGVTLAGWYAARLAQEVRGFTPVLAALCLVGAVIVAGRPLRALMAETSAPVPTCCPMDQP